MNLLSRARDHALVFALRLAVKKQLLPASLFAGTASIPFFGKQRDFRKYLDAMMMDESVAIALFRLSDAVSFADWDIIDNATKKPLEDEKAAVVQIFRKPNNFQTWNSFIELVLWHWYLTGNAFILKEKLSVSRPPVPTELWLMRPDQVKVKPDPIKFISGYEVHGATKLEFPIERVVHIKFNHPVDPYLGMGKIESAERLVDTSRSIKEWVNRFFHEGAEPGGIIRVKGRLNEDALRRLQRQFEGRHRGVAKSHLMAILENGQEYVKSGATPKEADFQATDERQERKILGLHGVPGMKAGQVMDVNRSTAQEIERAWQRDTIMPILRRLEPWLSKIAMDFGDFSFKFRKLVQEDMVDDVAIATGYFAAGMLTPNEGRERFLGLPPVNRPGMNDFYLPFNLIPIASVTDEPPPAPEPEPEDDDTEEETHEDDDEDQESAPRVFNIVTRQEGKPKKGTPVQERIFRLYKLERAHAERVTRRATRKFWREQENRVVRSFMDVHGRKFFMDDIFADFMENQLMLGAVGEKFSVIMQETFLMTTDLMGSEPGAAFEPGSPQFDKKFQRTTQFLKNVNQTTKNLISKTIDEGISLGLNPSAIAEGSPELGYAGIRGTYAQFSRPRAQLIARTESARSLDSANTQVYRDLGVQTCDVIGCEDTTKMKGQKWGCSSSGVPIAEAEMIKFHMNHQGAITPNITRGVRAPGRLATRVLTQFEGMEYKVQQMGRRLADHAGAKGA